jgi:VIT1/CCC1 family predicted Fe2+/Mn2+ transporter
VLLREHYWIALRVSNLVSVGVLFLTGYQWGKYSGSDPWKTGLLLAAIGVALAAIAIPLGG